MRLAAIALVALGACGPGAETPADAGVSDAGASDAGTRPALPAELPLVRRADAQSGLSHAFEWMGVVAEHGPAREIPEALGGVTPARALAVRDSAGTLEKVFYTLPKPLAFAAFPGEQVRFLYREHATGYGSSYGLRVTLVTGGLRVLVEDGTWGPALEAAERLGFSFTLDTGQPLLTDEVDGATRRHYPVVVKRGDHAKRLFYGQSETFTLDDGSKVTFHLVDAFRFEDAVAGGAPPLSIGYVVVPAP